MSTPGGWYAAQSKKNPDLFRVIFDFNRRPQNWVHAEVLGALPHAKVVTALSGSYHGSAHLAEWVTKELGLESAEPCWDFEDKWQRLALLSTETLGRLARFCGAALSWPKISSIIGKVEMQEVKAALGDDAHAFALRRGRLLVSAEEAVLPEGQDPLAPHTLEVGWRLVMTAMGEVTEPLRQRFELKMPPGLPKMNLGPVAPELRERAWQRVSKVTPEVLTEGELKCFA